MHHASHDLLTQLRTEWRGIARGRDARRVVARLRAAHPDVLPAHVTDLHGLVLALEPHGGLTQEERARVVTVLLDAAGEPLVLRCLLQTLLPGIIAVARRLQFGAGIADDPRTFLADALHEAVDLLSQWSGQHRRYAAPDLLNALRCRLRRRMLADKRRRAELVGSDHHLERAAPREDGLLRALATAVDDGVTDVDLLYARCVLECSVTSLAATLGVTNATLQRRLAAAATPFVGASS